MRSKRMMALLALSFFLICPAASGKGNAENILYAELLSGAVTREWQEQYGIRVERAWHDGHMNLTEVLQAEDAPDFFCISTQNADFEAIRNAGWLADLSASASIREDIASLPPVFRAALESEDGTIWGIPEAASFKHEVYWLPAAWEAMGWDTKKVPASYTELLDCLEAYSAHPQAGFCVFQFTADPGPQFTYRKWLLRLLVSIWHTQALYAGKSQDDENETFQALMERALSVGKALDEIDPPSVEEKKSLTPLFYSGLSGRGLCQYGSQTYTLRNLIPHRIDREQPALVCVSLTLYCCRANSVWSPQAAQLLESVIRHREGWKGFYLHPDAGDIQTWNRQLPDSAQAARFTRPWLDSLKELSFVPAVYPEGFRGDAYDQLIDQAARGDVTSFQFVRRMRALNEEKH